MQQARADGTLAGCEACHTTKSWKELSGFDHSKTKFPLLGAHRATACIDCHKPPNLETKLIERGLQGRAHPVRRLPRGHSRQAVREGRRHTLRRMPHQHEVEALAVRPREANRLPAARRPPERPLRRVPQTDQSCGRKDRALLQAHAERLRGVPRADESRAQAKQSGSSPPNDVDCLYADHAPSAA